MTKKLAEVPNSALLEKTGHPTKALSRWMNSVSRSSDIWHAAGVSYAYTGGRNSLQAIGFAAPGATAVVGAVGGTTTLGSLGYARYDSAAVANSTATTQLSNNPQFEMGDSLGRGGYRIELYCAVVTTQVTLRAFWGLAASTALTLAADPSAFVNCIGLAADAADSTMQIMYNDAAGTCTKVALAGMAKTSGAFYKLTLTCNSLGNSSQGVAVQYRVDRLDITTASPAAGFITTNMPSNVTVLGLTVLTGNGATAAAVQHGLVKAQAEVPMPI